MKHKQLLRWQVTVGENGWFIWCTSGMLGWLQRLLRGSFLIKPSFTSRNLCWSGPACIPPAGHAYTHIRHTLESSLFTGVLSTQTPLSLQPPVMLPVHRLCIDCVCMSVWCVGGLVAFLQDRCQSWLVWQWHVVHLSLNERTSVTSQDFVVVVKWPWHVDVALTKVRCCVCVGSWINGIRANSLLISVFTFAKEIYIFCPICLFVCLLAGYLKYLLTDFDEMWRRRRRKVSLKEGMNYVFGYSNVLSMNS